MIRSIGFICLLCVLCLTGWTCEQKKEEKPRFVIVNVLDKELFEDCNIKGSIQVPFTELKEYALNHWDKEKTEIVIHCSNYACRASGDGCRMLLGLGFKKVWAFEGGTAEAQWAGITMNGPCKESYLADYKKKETHTSPSVPVISVDELKKKIEEFAIKS